METRDEFFEIINSLEREKADYLNALFRNCPDKVIKETKHRKVPKGYHLLRAGDICNKVIIILNGKASGIDLQSFGNAYVFMEYAGLDVLGDFELFGDIPQYRISIQALTECEILQIPAKAYLGWMTKDVSALFMRTRKLMHTLTNQTSDERKYMFLGCKERMALYLTERYEKYGNKKEYCVRKKQTELAESLGFNVRTIQRSIQALEKAELITSVAGRIIISYEQYLKLKEYTGTIM